jgi:serine/threonine protein kinase
MPRILLVDDDAAVLKLVSLHISRAGYEVEECVDGVQAVGRAIADPPDLVICDLNLPGLDGFGVLTALRAQDKTSGIPVIFLTSHADHENIRRAMRLGADDFLRKPVDRADLLEAISSRLLRLELVRSAPLPILRIDPVADGAAPWPDARQVPAEVRELGDYVLEARIAKGGNSNIYLARRKSDGMQVALKLIRLDGHTPADVLSRFIKEHELLERLRHPNIVPIFGQGFTDHYAYIAMEYFPRGSLTAMLNAPLPQAAVKLVLQQCAAGLEAAHQTGIVHRDLKPDNVMLRADGTLALTDFGIAKDLHAPVGSTDHGIVLGTPAYMSPEQAMGKEVDASCDIYSLGVMLHQMLTGEKPFPGGDHQTIIYGHLNSPVPRLPAYAAQWQDLLDLMMAKLPPARPANATALLGCLAQFHVR